LTRAVVCVARSVLHPKADSHPNVERAESLLHGFMVMPLMGEGGPYGSQSRVIYVNQVRICQKKKKHPSVTELNNGMMCIFLFYCSSLPQLNPCGKIPTSAITTLNTKLPYVIAKLRRYFKKLEKVLCLSYIEKRNHNISPFLRRLL
jgi:hypothetical protein